MSGVQQWFSHKKGGIALGIATSGSCVGGLIMPLIITPINRHFGVSMYVYYGMNFGIIHVYPNYLTAAFGFSGVSHAYFILYQVFYLKTRLLHVKVDLMMKRLDLLVSNLLQLNQLYKLKNQHSNKY